MTEQIDILMFRNNGRVDFEALLSEQNISFRLGEKHGSIQTIEILETPAPRATALATVLCSWLKQRRARCIQLHLKNDEFVEMEGNGFSIEQVETFLEKIDFITVHQTHADDYRFEDDYTGFEEHLLRESGKSRSFNVLDLYERRQKSSAYFSTRASDMHAGAVVIWHACQTPVSFDPDREAQRLGLGEGFFLGVALPPVFALLAGLSIELQIKAVARLLDLENQKHHRIADLSKHVGITLSSEHAVFADALSEYVYWASRYPTPRNETQFKKAYDIFRNVGFPAALGEPRTLARYESLWTMLSLSLWESQEGYRRTIKRSAPGPSFPTTAQRRVGRLFTVCDRLAAAPGVSCCESVATSGYAATGPVADLGRSVASGYLCFSRMRHAAERTSARMPSTSNHRSLPKLYAVSDRGPYIPTPLHQVAEISPNGT